DDAFASLGGGVPTFTIDSVTDDTSPTTKVARQVKGKVTVPSYRNLPNGAPGSRFNYVASTAGLPARLGGAAPLSATFTCNIPPSAFTTPARPSLYGHGLLGDQGE